MVQAGLGKKRDPKSKITRAKRAAGIPLISEKGSNVLSLPCK
jgi:hypothetical protein